MYMRVVSGLDPEMFAQRFNETCEHFKNPQIKFVDELTAYVYGEENTPAWERDDPKKCEERDDRKCAECSYYDWGRRCLRGSGHKRPGDVACQLFTTQILTEAEIEKLKMELIKIKRSKGAENEKEIINYSGRKNN